MHCYLATVEAIAAAKKAQHEMYSALLTKREVLVEDLESKLTAYKGLLLKEMVKIHKKHHTCTVYMYSTVYMYMAKNENNNAIYYKFILCLVKVDTTVIQNLCRI